MRADIPKKEPMFLNGRRQELLLIAFSKILYLE